MNRLYNNDYTDVLNAIKKVENLNDLTSYLLQHGYYLTKAAPSTFSSRSSWRGAQETFGREED